METIKYTEVAKFIQSHVDARYEFSKELNGFLKSLHKSGEKLPFIKSINACRGGKIVKKGEIASFTTSERIASEYCNQYGDKVRDYVVFGICVKTFFELAYKFVGDENEDVFLSEYKQVIQQSERDFEVIGFRI